MMNSAILRLHCPDAPGIVYKVSGFIYERGGNIINAQQHTEELDQRFFMRVRFDPSSLMIDMQRFSEEWSAFAAAHSMEFTLHETEHKRRMAIMVSKYDHCLYELLLRHQYGEIPVEIACIISNHSDLKRVGDYFNIPFFHAPIHKTTKAEDEARQIAICEKHHTDFIALARYMQILSPEFTKKYANRIINVHHGFLPAFSGARPYHQAYEKGVKLIGATSHYVTDELDEGPIIEQETIRVDHSHSVAEMVRMGRDIERRVLARAVIAHAEDHIMVLGNRTIVFDD